DASPVVQIAIDGQALFIEGARSREVAFCARDAGQGRDAVGNARPVAQLTLTGKARLTPAAGLRALRLVQSHVGETVQDNLPAPPVSELLMHDQRLLIEGARPLKTTFSLGQLAHADQRIRNSHPVAYFPPDGQALFEKGARGAEVGLEERQVSQTAE